MPPDRPGLTWFAGWDVRGGTARGEPREAAVPLAELGRKSTLESYELLAVTARGFRPPKFLTITEVPQDDTPWEHDATLGARGPGGTELRQTWSLLYQLIAESNPRKSAPNAIYLLGVNPPPDATEDELEVFNDFYTNVHLREVAERRHALRAARYELLRELKAPFKGAPQFLAVYELDEEGASQRKHVGPPYSPGPAVWQGHRTPWRLWFRRIGDLE